MPITFKNGVLQEPEFNEYVLSLERRIWTYRAALESIARNTCCNGCQEAAKVARAALEPPRVPGDALGQRQAEEQK